MSDFITRTPNKDQQVEQLFSCLLAQVVLPEDVQELCSSRITVCYPHGCKIVPRGISGTTLFALTDSHDSSTIL